MENVIASYAHIKAVGGNYHSLTLYSTYTDERGLEGEVHRVDVRRATELLKGLGSYLTKEQKATIRSLAKDKEDSRIVLRDGTIRYN